MPTLRSSSRQQPADEPKKKKKTVKLPAKKKKQTKVLEDDEEFEAEDESRCGEVIPEDKRNPVVYLERVSTPEVARLTQKKNNKKRNNEEMVARGDGAKLLQMFPKKGDSQEVQIDKLSEVKGVVLAVFSEVMSRVQEEEHNFEALYARVEEIYEVCTKSVAHAEFVKKYKIMCVNLLYGFGAVAWKIKNKFTEKVSAFLCACFLRLGWGEGEGRRKAERLKNGIMRIRRDEESAPACYTFLKLFLKYHNDVNPNVRLEQLSVLEVLASTAKIRENEAFLMYVVQQTMRRLFVRLKDKSVSCRLKTISILGHLTEIEGAEAIPKELKYFTRYDPSADVRKLGTTVLASTRMKLRFFFDQAFDKSLPVRMEAFRAFVREEVDEDGELALVRDMEQITADKLCKIIIWGIMYSEAKISEFVKNEVLPRWLRISCNGDLVLFLQRLDAYDHMRAVLKILDVMLTPELVESLDLSFVSRIIESIKARRFKDISIEGMVAWLGLCNASVKVESIQRKVIPEADTIVTIVDALHNAVILESQRAEMEKRGEDVTPVIAVTVSLEIARLVDFEEGTRSMFVKQLQRILLDPLLDERPLVEKAMVTLHKFVPAEEYEDVMMGVFQDVFDPNNESLHNGTALEQEMSKVSVHDGNNDDQENEDVVEPVEVEPPVHPPAPSPPRLTKLQIARLRDELNDVSLKRIYLNKQKQRLIEEKRFLEAMPINEEILDVHQKEIRLQNELNIAEQRFNQQAVARQSPAVLPVPTPPRSEVSTEKMSTENVDELVNDVIMTEDGDEGEDENVRVGVIGTVEQGLAKGLCMINAHLDLCPKMSSFIRNIYQHHVGGFITQQTDPMIVEAVCRLLARISIIEPEELHKITSFMIFMILGDDKTPPNVKHAAFTSLVDFVVHFEFDKFLPTQREIESEAEETKIYFANFTQLLREMVDRNAIYQTVTRAQMQGLLTYVLADKYPPALNDLNDMETNMATMAHNQGILKLFIRGRMREPRVIARVLALWVNQDYTGTPLLRDLDHVLGVTHTFQWWDEETSSIVEGQTPEELVGAQDSEGQQDDTIEPATEFKVNESIRVLGCSVVEAIVLLCGKGVDDEQVGKFLAYMLRFIDIKDQPLMRTMVNHLLDKISKTPARSYNLILLRMAMRIPLTNMTSASLVVAKLKETVEEVKEQAEASTFKILWKMLGKFLCKLKRVFGDDIADGLVLGQLGEEDDDDQDDLAVRSEAGEESVAGSFQDENENPQHKDASFSD